MGLFDGDSELFHKALLYAGALLLAFLTLGLLYEFVRRIRARAKVHDKGN